MNGNRDVHEVLLSPLLIVGAERSGTTWLQRMFLSHPGVVGGQESEFFLRFTPAMGSVKRGQQVNERLVGLGWYWKEEDFYEEIRQLWEETFQPLFENRRDVNLLVEKTPSHCIHMAAIKDVLPKAKFIHIIRDSRAVVASMLAASRGWGKHWAPGTAKDAAVSWWVSVSAGRKNGAALESDEYAEVNYESLLINPIAELRRLYDFAGLPYTETLLEQIVEANRFEKQKTSTEAAFVTHFGERLVEPKGFHRKGQADSWKRDLTVIEKLVVWRYTHSLMRECGYNWSGYAKAVNSTGTEQHGSLN